MVKRTKEEADVQDEIFGYEDFKQGDERLGWMVTYAQVYMEQCLCSRMKHTHFFSPANATPVRDKSL